MKFKKMATIFLSVCILATMSFGLTVEAAVNIAPNPDFSQWENGMPVGWNISVTRDPDINAGIDINPIIEKVDTSSDDAVESDSALLLRTVKAATGKETSGFRFNVSLAPEYRNRMIPGETYEISFKYKRLGGMDSQVIGVSSNSLLNRDETLVNGDKPYDTTLGWLTKDAWKEFKVSFTAHKDRNYHTFMIDTRNGGVWYLFMTDVKIMGVRRPGSAKTEQGANIISNGDFASGNTGWTLSNGAAVADGSVALTGSQTLSYDLTFSAQPAKNYAFEIDVKTTGAADVAAAAGAPKVAVDTYVGDVLLENGVNGSGFFFNRLTDFNYTFAPRALDTWEKIKFNYCPPDEYQWQNLTVRFTFSSAVEGVTVSYDNFKLQSTHNLFGNHDFEGLLVTSREAEGYPHVFGMHGPWNVSVDETITYLEGSAEQAYNGGVSAQLMKTDAEPFLGQQVRVESGKSYHMVFKTKNGISDMGAENKVNGTPGLPHFYWQALTGETGLSDAQSGLIAAQPRQFGYWDSGEAYFTMPTANTVNGETEAWNTKQAQVMFRMYGAEPGTFLFLDDIELTEVDTGVNFYTENAEKINKISEAKGKDVYAYYCSPNLPTDREITFFLALYDVSGDAPMLVNFTTHTGTTSLSRPIYNSIAIPDDGGKYKLSAFCLDSVAELHALEEKVDLTD